MKVYILTHNEPYDYTTILGVFYRKDKAKAFIETNHDYDNSSGWKGDIWHLDLEEDETSCDWIYVKEYEVMT